MNGCLFIQEKNGQTNPLNSLKVDLTLLSVFVVAPYKHISEKQKMLGFADVFMAHCMCNQGHGGKRSLSVVITCGPSLTWDTTPP